MRMSQLRTTSADAFATVLAALRSRLRLTFYRSNWHLHRQGGQDRSTPLQLTRSLPVGRELRFIGTTCVQSVVRRYNVS